MTCFLAFLIFLNLEHQIQGAHKLIATRKSELHRAKLLRRNKQGYCDFVNLFVGFCICFNAMIVYSFYHLVEF